MKDSSEKMFIGVRRVMRSAKLTAVDCSILSSQPDGVGNKPEGEQRQEGHVGSGWKEGGFSRNGKGKLSAKEVADAAELAAQNMPFEVVYYPRVGWTDFVVKAEDVEKAWYVAWTFGMRVKMARETEDSSRITWFQGTVSSASFPDSGLWRSSPWRMLQGHKQWLAEVQFLGVVEHPNLVKLIGYCAVDTERGIQRLLVYEYMPNKSLEYHLFNKAYDPLPWKTRLEIALGAGRGLAYLHEELEVQVIYRDFKTSNVLLDENFRPKLSDFGLAREGPIAGHTHVSTAVMGTHGYAAPDYLETGHLTTKSDVWSFGVVLYEILTGRRSLDRNRPKTEQKLLEWVKLHPTNRRNFSLIIDPRLEGQYSINVARNVAKLAADCLSKSAKERPRMSQVVERLRQIIINADESNPGEKNINLFENDDLLDEEEKSNQPNPSKLWQRRMAHLAKLGEPVETAEGRRFMTLQKTKSGS